MTDTLSHTPDKPKRRHRSPHGIANSDLKQLAQLVANFVINIWMPKHRAWKKEQELHRE